jgi:peptidyl-prolyl cis-trans isomerase C
MSQGRKLLSVFALFLSIVAAGASSCDNDKSNLNSEPRAVSVVNGEPISIEQFQKALDDLKDEGKGFLANAEQERKLKRELLERMIDDRLLAQEAHEKNISLDPRLLDAAIQPLFDEYPAGGVEEELLKQGKSLEQYKRETAHLLLLQKLLKREVTDRIAVSKEEVSKYFDEHRSEFLEPEQVRVRQIVSKSEEKAEALRKRILRGESFEDLAREYSLGPEASRGGDLGYFSKGLMPPAIEEACFKLRSPHVSKVVASPYGFHLFMLVDRKPARELSLQQATAKITRRLVMEKTKEAEAFFLRTLREGASIERDLELVDRIH